MGKNKRLLIGGLLLIVLAFTGMNAGSTARAQKLYVSTDAEHPEKITLEKGQTMTITFTGKTAVSWKSGDASIVSVSQSGILTAKKAGTVLVTADLGRLRCYYRVTVHDKTLDYVNAVKTGKLGGLSESEKKWAAKARQIIKKNITDDMTKAEKAKAIHDYLVLHTAYDNDNYNQGTIPDASYTPEGALLRGSAVCQGYAQAYEILLRAMDIPCKMITGTAGGPHAWNLVKLGGSWYHVDVTWDDPVPDREGFVQYKYFLVPDKIMKQDHKWKAADYPSCTSMKYYYYGDKDYIVKSADQFREKFAEQFRQGKKYITVMYPEKKYPDWNTVYDYASSFRYIPLWKKGKYYVITVIIN